jgi:hypothetical protein
MPTNSHLGAALILFLMATAPAAKELPAVTGESTRWELKGVHLGASLVEVQTQLPNATCTPKPEDPGIVLCIDATNSLGGEPASVAAMLLDGRVVKVAIEKLTYEQAFSACAPLTGKFGVATDVSRIRVNLQRGRYVQMEHKERCVWRDGENSLYLEPADWTDRKKMFTYSALILVDEARHNREWVVRYNSKNAPSDL